MFKTESMYLLLQSNHNTYLQGKTWKLEHNINVGHTLHIHSHKQGILHPLEIQSVCIYRIDISLLCQERAFKLLHSPTAASGGANISLLQSKFTLLSLNENLTAEEHSKFNRKKKISIEEERVNF